MLSIDLYVEGCDILTQIKFGLDCVKRKMSFHQ